MSFRLMILVPNDRRQGGRRLRVLNYDAEPFQPGRI
jgi:hypothetical protein